MSVRTKGTSQVGALYVEAAIVMPILLLVTFASLFFLLVAARHFSLQMLANEIAKDVSLSLQPPSSRFTTACIPQCMSGRGTFLRADGYAHTVDLTDYSYAQMSSDENQAGCWRSCARDKYLLATPTSNSDPYGLRVFVTAHPSMQLFDEQLPANGSVAAAGDFFEVTLTYPLRSVWGGGIAFFGLIPLTSKIYGNAVGVIDKRENL